ncbi:MAG: hypothetical protein ACE5GN_00885 [Waddliaceae bacterium]
MTFVEFIGFIIAIVAFFFLMAKQAREQRRRRENPEQYEEELEEQEVAIKKLLQSFNIEVEEEPATKPPPPPAPEGVGPPEVKIPCERLSDEGAEKDKQHIEEPLRQMWKKPKTSTKLSKLGEGREEVFRKPHEEYRGGLVEERREEVFRKPHEGKRVKLEELKPDHEEAYKIHKQKKSRAKKILGELDSLRNAIILREVLGPPKAFDKHIP